MKMTIKTPEQIKAEGDAAARAAEQAEARAYLADTDWYVARLTETKKPIPKGVLEGRAKARSILST